METQPYTYSVRYNAEKELSSQDIIGNGLNNFNAGQIANSEAAYVNIYVKNQAGEVIGGMIGTVWLQWLNIQNLWIDEQHRGQRIGTAVMQFAEKDAREKGYLGIYLDTLSFQAKGFYEKLGYTVFGVLEGFPDGHTRYFFQKKLR
jgi:ribosomal protein S18 acetylase RimI-like enzyme